MCVIGWETETDLNATVPQGWSVQPVFGQRFAIPTGTTADIWTGTALVRPLPLVPTPMSIVSNSANDSLVTALGAQFAQVTFIDELGDWRTSDLLPLNGLTPVPITYKPGQRLVTAGAQPTFPDGTSTEAQIFRVQDVAVLVAPGATVAAPKVFNQGVLRVVDTATGLIAFDHMPIGYSRSSSAAFHCPRNFGGRLTRVHVGTARGSGRVSINATFGLGTSFQQLPLVPVNDAAVVFLNDAPTTPISQRADIQASIVTGTNNIDVSCVLQVRLIPLTQ